MAATVNPKLVTNEMPDGWVLGRAAHHWDAFPLPVLYIYPDDRSRFHPHSYLCCTNYKKAHKICLAFY